MAYSGIYKVKNVKKYRGNVKNVVFRSLWELYCFKWCDKNEEIISWSSEEIIIPYIDETRKKKRRYFVDLYIESKDEIRIIEIKPKKETMKPKFPGRRTKKYLTESMTFVQNQNKWEAAIKFAEERGWKFQIWTEETLRQMGIMKMKSLPAIISNKKEGK